MRYVLFTATVLFLSGCETLVGQRAVEGAGVVFPKILENPTIPGASGAIVEYLLYTLGGLATAGSGYLLLKKKREASVPK